MSDKRVDWEKWRDPLGRFTDEREEFQSRKDYSSSEFEDEQKELSIKPVFVVTAYGIIPVNSHNNPSKFFNWWIGHVNFVLTNRMVDGIDHIPGVETFDVLSGVRFKIAIGMAFDENEVLEAVEDFLYSCPPANKRCINCSA